MTKVWLGAGISMAALFGLGYLMGEQRGWKKGVQNMQEAYR